MGLQRTRMLYLRQRRLSKLRKSTMHHMYGLVSHHHLHTVRKSSSGNQASASTSAIGI